MGSSKDQGFELNDPRIAERRERIVARFEAAWIKALQGGDPPKIDVYLGEVPENERPPLREALEAIRRGPMDATLQFGPAPTLPATQLAPGQAKPVEADVAATIQFAPSEMAHAKTQAPKADRADTVEDHNLSQTKPPQGETGDGRTAELTQAWIAVAGDTANLNITLDHEGVTAPAVPRSMQITGRRTEMPKVPGYLLIQELGRGGMGVVYKAHHQALERFVALKMVLAGAHADEEQLERFRLEARAVAHLKHNNIVQIYDINEHEGLPYFALEFLDGGNLTDRIDGMPAPPRFAAEIAETLARAMKVAHDAGIIHRDLKPANILMTKDGQPKITDFGLAKKLEGDSNQTRSGSIMGTPAYMPPEQALGLTKEIGPVSDQYALGAILYELLTGRPPFQGANPLDTLEMVRKQEPIPPTRLQPKVPIDLETICLKALQKDPNKRYADCGKLADDLKNFMEGRPIEARPISAPERLLRWTKRNPWIAAAIATAAAALVLIAGISTASAIQINRKATELAKTNDDLDKSNKRLDESNKSLAIETKRANKAADDALKSAAAEKAAKEKETAAKSAAQASAEAAIAARNDAQVKTKRAVEANDVARQRTFKALEGHRFLTVLAYERLKFIAGTRKVRQELLDTASRELLADLAAVEDIKDKMAGIVDIGLNDRTVAGIYQRQGRLLQEVGQLNDAKKAFERMDGIVAKLIASNPTDPVFLQVGGASKNTLGDLLFNMGETEAARACYLKAYEYRKARTDEKPDDDNRKIDMANQLGLLAKIELSLGNPAKAMEHYQEELKWRDSVSPQGNMVQEVNRERGSFYEKIGETYYRLGQKEAAQDYFNRALALRKRLLENGQGDPLLLHDMSLCHRRLGDALLMFVGDTAAALDNYKEAFTIIEQRFKDDPEDVQNKQDLATVHYQLATAYRRLGEEEAAKSHFAKCLAMREPMARDPETKLSLMAYLVALACADREQEAVKLADELISIPPQDAQIYFQAACGYSLAADSVARRAGEKPSDEDSAAIKTYLGKSLAALEAGSQRGWRDVISLETDPDLDAVRKAPEFKPLVEKMRQANEKVAQAGGSPKT